LRSLKGMNQTSHDTSWRQSCNTCMENELIFWLIIKKEFQFKFFSICQGLVRFCADYRIKPHAPPLVVGSRQFLW